MNPPVDINILDFNKALRRQLGKAYKYGAEVRVDADISGESIYWDCSELFQVLFNKYESALPDGSQNQFNFCSPMEKAAVGDLGFSGPSIARINHVIYLVDRHTVLEARGKPYNQVILRPRVKWEKWRGFQGWRMVPDVQFYWPDGRPVRDYSKI